MYDETAQDCIEHLVRTSVKRGDRDILLNLFWWLAHVADVKQTVDHFKNMLFEIASAEEGERLTRITPPAGYPGALRGESHLAPVKKTLAESFEDQDKEMDVLIKRTRELAAEAKQLKERTNRWKKT